MKTDKSDLNLGTKGFTMSETLVSIALMLILSASLCFVLTSLFLNQNKGLLRLQDIRLLGKTDSYLREKAANSIFPYWSNASYSVEYFTSSLFTDSALNGVSIISTSSIKSDDGTIRGISVKYRINNINTIYQTDCAFGSIPVVGNK